MQFLGRQFRSVAFARRLLAHRGATRRNGHADHRPSRMIVEDDAQTRSRFREKINECPDLVVDTVAASCAGFDAKHAEAPTNVVTSTLGKG